MNGNLRIRKLKLETSGETQKTGKQKGKKQKAESRKQKAESRKQKAESRNIGNRDIKNRKEKAPFPLREPGLVGRSEPVWRSSRNEHISDAPLHSYRKNE
ncbi:hypothetical protein L4D17_11785 [Vibrio splendidus]|uniref:hypothetical protein n=1 Tax=Vibrio splendidus TaxID=29497 RepID=UPI003D10E285